mgnify:CR=1 FL=1
MTAKIVGFDQDNQRISTQQLLQQIYAELENGQTEFEILSSGHHDIGGPLWTQDGSPLKFRVKNPGQRVGSFALDGTEIVVDGSAKRHVDCRQLHVASQYDAAAENDVMPRDFPVRAESGGRGVAAQHAGRRDAPRRGRLLREARRARHLPLQPRPGPHRSRAEAGVPPGVPREGAADLGDVALRPEDAALRHAAAGAGHRPARGGRAVVGAILAGLLADAFSIPVAIAVIGAADAAGFAHGVLRVDADDFVAAHHGVSRRDNDVVILAGGIGRVLLGQVAERHVVRFLGAQLGRHLVGLLLGRADDLLGLAARAGHQGVCLGLDLLGGAGHAPRKVQMQRVELAPDERAEPDGRGEELVDEIDLNARALEELTGRRPRFYRSGTAYYDEVAVQVAAALGQQQLVMARVLDQQATRLHQSLLQAGQRPVLDLLRQHQPPPLVPQVVRDHAQP